jgi:hypothetical protein
MNNVHILRASNGYMLHNAVRFCVSEEETRRRDAYVGKWHETMNAAFCIRVLSL